MRFGIWLIVLACLASSVSAQSWPERQVADLVAAASAQIGVTTTYDGSYQRIVYPGGDVEITHGVCTDVLIRAYRKVGLDLQKLVHEDMRQSWSKYPKLWGLRRPDPNIDHRRVPNLFTFFKRHGKSLETSQDLTSYRMGDIVTQQLDSGLPHIGLVADSKSSTGVPLVLHNIGAGVQLEDVLFAHEITGHFRFLPNQLVCV